MLRHDLFFTIHQEVNIWHWSYTKSCLISNAHNPGCSQPTITNLKCSCPAFAFAGVEMVSINEGCEAGSRDMIVRKECYHYFMSVGPLWWVAPERRTSSLADAIDVDDTTSSGQTEIVQSICHLPSCRANAYCDRCFVA